MRGPHFWPMVWIVGRRGPIPGSDACILQFVEKSGPIFSGLVLPAWALTCR